MLRGYSAQCINPARSRQRVDRGTVTRYEISTTRRATLIASGEPENASAFGASRTPAGGNAKHAAMMVTSSAGGPAEPRDQPGGSWPPGPKGLPLLGNLLEFRRDALRYYSEWSRQYGDIVALRLGTWPAVLLNPSDYVEHVLVKNARNFIKFPFFFRHVREIFGQGLLTSEGELWHRQRRLAAP